MRLIRCQVPNVVTPLAIFLKLHLATVLLWECLGKKQYKWREEFLTSGVRTYLEFKLYNLHVKFNEFVLWWTRKYIHINWARLCFIFIKRVTCYYIYAYIYLHMSNNHWLGKVYLITESCSAFNCCLFTTFPWEIMAYY